MERKENVAQIEFFSIHVQRDLITLCTLALASMYKGKHASNRVISVIFSVILNQRTSSTLQSSALKINELSAVEVGESRRDKSKPLLGT